MIQKKLYFFIQAVLFIAMFAMISCVSPEIKELDTNLREFVIDKNFSGAVLVVHNNRLVLSRGYGLADREKNIPNTPDTKFRIASITKQFTAMAVLILQHRGKLDVKDRINKYLPGVPSRWEDITIHHLLIHSSGIPNFSVGTEYAEMMGKETSPDEIIANFNDRRLVFQPGTKWQYSNTNYIVLGRIIEQASGVSYESFLRENIFNPLGMTSTGYDHNNPDLAVGYWDDKKAPYLHMSIPFASGGLYSTIKDLYSWDQALYTEKLVPQKLIDEMFTPHIHIPNYVVRDNSNGYGWIIKEGEERVYAHDGRINGFSSLITRYPGENSLILVLSNQEHFNCYWIQFEILKHLFDTDIYQTVEVDSRYSSYPAL